MKLITLFLQTILSLVLIFLPNILCLTAIIAYFKLFSEYKNNFRLNQSKLTLGDVEHNLYDFNEYIIALIIFTVFVIFLSTYITKRISIKQTNLLSFNNIKDKKSLLLIAKMTIIIVASIISINILMNWTNIGQESNTNVFFLKNSLFITALYLGILIPIKEEIIFRGIIFSAIENKFSPFIAFIVSSALFGLMHFQGLNIASVFFLIIAFSLGFLRLKTNSLLPSIFLHIFNNLMGVIVTYYELL